MWEYLEGGKPTHPAPAKRSTPDQLETDLLACEAMIGRLRAHQAVATARLVTVGGEDAVEWSRRLDIAGVRRLTAHRRRINRVAEQEANRAQHLRIYPNFDKSQYQTSGSFGALGGRTVERFLQQFADGLPTPAGEAAAPLPAATPATVSSRNASERPRGGGQPLD